MHRKRKNKLFKPLLGGVATVALGTIFVGWWNQPDTPEYSDWPISSDGYILNLRTDVSPPNNPVLPEIEAAAISPVTPTETMHTESKKEILELPVLHEEPSEDMAMRSELETTPKEIVQESLPSLRLPDETPEVTPSPIMPKEPMKPSSPLAVAHENPYLTTD